MHLHKSASCQVIRRALPSLHCGQNANLKWLLHKRSLQLWCRFIYEKKKKKLAQRLHLCKSESILKLMSWVFLHFVCITKQIIHECLKKKKIQTVIHNRFSLFCSCFWKTFQSTEQRVSILPSRFPQVIRLVKKKDAADGSSKNVRTQNWRKICNTWTFSCQKTLLWHQSLHNMKILTLPTNLCWCKKAHLLINLLGTIVHAAGPKLFGCVAS